MREVPVGAEWQARGPNEVEKGQRYDAELSLAWDLPKAKESEDGGGGGQTALRVFSSIWVRVKIKPPGDRRVYSLVPFARPHFGYLLLTHANCTAG